MNENEYLEAMNQLKEKFDANEKKVTNVMEQNIQLKKHLMVAYGLSKMVDILDDSADEYERNYIYGNLRQYLSEVIEQDILCMPLNYRSVIV
tara:strand:+ start:491 stop:766 length:276 start_codon:yes stop_codon:yes gene_type:complete